jgi:excisionase family DNA binding protein
MSNLGRALIADLNPDDLADLAELLAPYLPRSTADDGWMNTRAAAEYLGMSVSALHRLTAAREIPCSQDGPGARCFFRRSDLDGWRGATAS